MILYYALGGGLGHLVRARRVLEALGFAHRAAIVTASEHASDARITGAIPIVAVPRELENAPVAHRAWLRALMFGRTFERMIVDTFPGGIQGELTLECGGNAAAFERGSAAALHIDYVARLLRWEAYRRAVPGALPSFDTTYVVEELTPEHEAFVRANSRRVVALDLTPRIEPEPLQDYWVVVHSGPAEEVRELVAYAQELLALERDRPRRVLVATRCATDLPARFEAVDVHPASRLFPAAKRIVSAAGFNVMRETEAFREKHSVLPFRRKFDDQYLRAARRRSTLSSAHAPAPCAAR